MKTVIIIISSLIAYQLGVEYGAMIEDCKNLVGDVDPVTCVQELKYVQP